VICAKTPEHKRHIHISTLPGLVLNGRWRTDGLRALGSHEFIWITRGQGRATVGATTRGISANNLLFVPAGKIQAIFLSNNMQGYACYLPDDLPIPVPGQPCLIKAKSIFEQGQLTGYFEQISSEHLTQKTGASYAMESYMTLISVWMERNQPLNDWPDPRASTRSAHIVGRFLTRLEREYRTIQSVSAYAKILNVTPTHLSRVCSSAVGKPALELIQDRLILAAKCDLCDTELRIHEVSERLGFASAAYFTRFFGQRCGLSPSQYRAEQGQGLAPRRQLASLKPPHSKRS